MKIWKNCMLFYLGGMIYLFLEFSFRGWSHGSMFLAGGLCFLGLGWLLRQFPRMPLAVKTVLGAALVTAVELAAGLLVNRDLRIWDYSGLRYNFRGQICLNFSLLWMPVSLAGMWLYERVKKYLDALSKNVGAS